ncbi:MAG: IPT/TIG domain-containing protein [Myxococcota bacterium]
MNAASLRVDYDLTSLQPGTYPVVVEHPNGQQSNTAFFVVSAKQLPKPVLTSISPTSISLNTNQSVFINGKHFQSGAQVSVRLPMVGVVNYPTNYVNSSLLVVIRQPVNVPFPFTSRASEIFVINPDKQESNRLQITIRP